MTKKLKSFTEWLGLKQVCEWFGEDDNMLACGEPAVYVLIDISCPDMHRFSCKKHLPKMTKLLGKGFRIEKA